MQSDRYEKGLAMMRRIKGEDKPAVLESLQDIAPDFARYIVEFAFGDIYARPGLDVKTREIVAVAALTAIKASHAQLKGHIASALNAGWTQEEVLEAIMQVVIYAGFPAALNGLLAAKEAFAERA